eukprot:435141-Rhodomonas_salina.1
MTSWSPRLTERVATAVCRCLRAYGYRVLCARVRSRGSAIDDTVCCLTVPPHDHGVLPSLPRNSYRGARLHCTSLCTQSLWPRTSV